MKEVQSEDNGLPPSNDQLTAALLQLLAPLAKLCLANGVTFASAEELLKQSFVQVADQFAPDAPEHGKVSRISTITGISRREVTRLARSGSAVKSAKHPLVAEVFARWTSDPKYKDEDGAPLELKRQGQAPSFDALASSITRDVHPRSMLAELVRLGVARHNEAKDLVILLCNDFVPGKGSGEIISFLGNNVGDHLSAAVSNVLQDGPQHHEQAVFADELSAQSIAAFLPLLGSQWTALRQTLVTALAELIEADKLAGRKQDQRVRIGMYSFTESMSPADAGRMDCSPSSAVELIQKDITDEK